MAKPKKLPAPQTADTSKVIAPGETPQIKWNIIAQIGVVVVVVWALAIGLIPYVGHWHLYVLGALTVALLGFGGYVWNLTRKQGRLMEIMKNAADPEGRKQAIAQLAAEGDSDAMNQLARAQLVAQENPDEAIEILERIDVAKAPALLQDDIRVNRALLYLAVGRPREARDAIDSVKPETAPQAKSKALYMAVVAEAKARTGSAKDAKTLIDAVNVDDPENAEILPLVYRAQIFTYFGTKNRGLARKAMVALGVRDPNLLGPFMQRTPGVEPQAQNEMQTMVREVLGELGYGTRAKQKLVRG